MKTPKADKRKDAGKTESGVDAGTKKETAASEVSGKADLTESRARVDLPSMSLPPGVAGNAKLRNSLRKYGNPSPFNWRTMICWTALTKLYTKEN